MFIPVPVGFSGLAFEVQADGLFRPIRQRPPTLGSVGLVDSVVVRFSILPPLPVSSASP
jgi:hypothetical protein